MPYKRVRDHGKIIEYVSEFLREWQVKREFAFAHPHHVRADIFAFHSDLNVALVVEAKTSSENAAISGGIGQLLFYRELLQTKDFNDVLFSLAIPGSMVDLKLDLKTGEWVKLEKPSYAVPITDEAFNFAKRHNIGVFGVAIDGKVFGPVSKFPLSLWLLVKDLETKE